MPNNEFVNVDIFDTTWKSMAGMPEIAAMIRSREISKRKANQRATKYAIDRVVGGCETSYIGRVVFEWTTFTLMSEDGLIINIAFFWGWKSIPSALLLYADFESKYYVNIFLI